MNRSFLAVWLLMAVATMVAICGNAYAADLAPYDGDSNTLHLYHFDEEQGAFKDAVSQDKSFDLSRRDGAGIMRSTNDFGNALDTRSKIESRAITGKLISSRTLWNQTSRAFTYEALVRIDFEPQSVLEGRHSRMMIASVDSDKGASRRAFEFCLRTPGVYGATTASLEFMRFAGEGEGFRVYPIVAPLPRSGPHAPQRGKWYHVAVTYNGEVDTPDNVKFYWTGLSSDATQANLIHKGTMTHEMPAQQKVLNLAIGNSARRANGYQENWIGQIDEVRISDIARAADGFIFSNASGDQTRRFITSNSPSHKAVDDTPPQQTRGSK